MKEAVVIIPTYNERENIVSIIDLVFSLEQPFHVIIVDDGSPDGTADLIRNLQVKYNVDRERLMLISRSGKLGLGTAYITGFKYALNKSYRYILEMDADFSHDPHDLVKLLKVCQEGAADFSIGSRYATGVNVVNWPIGRVLLSYFASTYVRLITGMPIRDTTAGFVCYSRRVLETIDLDKIKFVGYAFQIEMKFQAWKYGFRIVEIPIIFTERTRGESKLSKGIFQEAFFGVLQMTIRSWFRKYIPNEVSVSQTE